MNTYFDAMCKTHGRDGTYVLPITLSKHPTPLEISSHDPSNLSTFDPPRDSKSYPETFFVKTPFNHSSSDDGVQTGGKAIRTARSSNWQLEWSTAVEGHCVRYGWNTLVRCLASLFNFFLIKKNEKKNELIEISVRRRDMNYCLRNLMRCDC